GFGSTPRLRHAGLRQRDKGDQTNKETRNAHHDILHRPLGRL
ncbi:MAG: hypothetical protein JWN07_2015, partial [Hyphomicrobiales bacterium]|nr:hypothetical protein [Hyphomicrobiales bacterium]